MVEDNESRNLENATSDETPAAPAGVTGAPAHAAATSRNGFGGRRGITILVAVLVLVLIAASIAYYTLLGQVGSGSSVLATDGTTASTAANGSAGSATGSAGSTAGSGATQTSGAASASSGTAQAGGTSSSTTSSVLPNTPDERHAATDVTIRDASGASLQLSSITSNGKPTIVNFWATWCPYCRTELEEMDGIVAEYSDRVNFVPIDSVDGTRETMQNGLDFFADKGYTFPTYFDTDNQAAVIAYNASSLPTTIVIDRNGNLVGYHAGLMKTDTITAVIDALLAE